MDEQYFVLDMDKVTNTISDWLGITEGKDEIEQEEKKEELIIPVHEPRLCNT